MGFTMVEKSKSSANRICIWLRNAIAVFATLSFSSPAAIERLTVNDIRELEIAAGETHSFALRAKPGQFIHLAVDQIGADVVLKLLSPDGREAAMSDFPNSAWGPEVVAVLAELDGDYTASVSQPNPKAARGRYEIRVLGLGAASAADIDRAKAEGFVGRAEKLRQQRTAQALNAAKEEYRQALPFFISANEPYRAGLIVNAMGLIYARTGDMKQAAPLYDQAIQFFRRSNNLRGEANAANNAGGAFDVLGDFPKAFDYYQRSQTMSHSVGDVIDEALALMNLGKLLNDQAQWEKALDAFQKALPIFQAAEDWGRLTTVLGNMAAVFRKVGDYDLSRDYLTRAIDSSTKSGDPNAASPALRSMGQAFLLEGRIPEALAFFEQALSRYQARGDKRGAATTLSFVGICHARLGATAKAVEVLTQASDALRVAGDRRGEAITLNNLADVYIRIGEPKKAAEYGTQALAAFSALGDHSSEAEAYTTLARVERKQGHLTEARGMAEKALNSIEQARGGAAAGESRASFFASQQDAYAFTIDLLMEMGDAGAALAVSERARARSLLEMLAEGSAKIREGVDPKLLEKETELGSILNAKGARLMPIADQKSARAMELQQEIRNLEREYQELQAQIRKSSPRYASLTQPQPLGVRQIQQEVLDEDTLLAEYSLGDSRSFLWIVSRDSMKSFELPGRAVIEAKTQQVYDLLTARAAKVRGEQPAEHEARIAAADEQLPKQAQELSEMILRPAAAMLAGKRLVIVPDGGLQRLPFAILPMPVTGEPLLVSHEITILPSASALAVLRTEIRKPAPKMLAVFADPVFDKSDPRAGRTARAKTKQVAAAGSRVLEHTNELGSSTLAKLNMQRLPYTAEEARQILRWAADSSNMAALDFKANRALTIGGQLSEYRYIHFATHGYLDAQRPNLSALVLSQIDEAGQSLDGFLRVSDVYNLKLRAELVVLSACQTGLGKEVRGEGLMGLTRAFLYAGAPRVVVSLWNVNDRATADLMSAMYKDMLRKSKTPAAALRAAQLELRKSKHWKSPYYWAAFEQYGEYK